MPPLPDVVGTRYSPVQIFGLGEAEMMLTRIAHNLSDVRGAKPAVDESLSQAYEERFRRWNGFMVDTGKTKEVWTSKQNESGNDAIRLAHFDAIEYGSSVWYNTFHAKALLRVTPTMRVKISELMLAHFVGAPHAVR
jgi:hypothetical protein